MSIQRFSALERFAFWGYNRDNGIRLHPHFDKRYDVLVGCNASLFKDIKLKLELNVVKNSKISPLGVVIAYANFILLFNMPITDIYIRIFCIGNKDANDIFSTKM